MVAAACDHRRPVAVALDQQLVRDQVESPSSARSS
jgi:hypothetical protein